MITHNCGETIGSLIHRAQGYKKLKEEMNGQLSIPRRIGNQKFFINNDTTVYNRNGLRQFLKKGTLVISRGLYYESCSKKVVDIQVIENERHGKSDGLTFQCPIEKLNQVMEKENNQFFVSPIEEIKQIKEPKHKSLSNEKLISQSGKEMYPGKVHWRSPVGEKNKDCGSLNCDRSSVASILVNKLLAEEKYSERKGFYRSKQDYDGANDFKTADLLGLHEENYDRYSNSPKKYLTKDYKDFIEDEHIYNKPPLNDLSDDKDGFEVGSLVEVSIRDTPHYGVIKWIGKLDNCTSSFLIAGIELEEEIINGENGYVQGRKYFDCAPQKGYFTLLQNCKKDSRFSDSSYLSTTDSKVPWNPECVIIPGIVEPVNQFEENMNSLFGKYNGIQGHNNSCYLDATLFAMFTFTSVFDCLLLRPANTSDCDYYEDVQRVLREEIVNPLRKNFFVHADSVMKLRKLLDNCTSVTGLTCEEKDPEEFLTSLMTQVLKAEPFLKLSSGHETFYHQLFVEKDEHLKLPNVQQLFEQSLISSDIKLKEVPSCLIIQMPRFGKTYKMYPRIMQSQILDITDFIENAPRQCSVCGELAEFECKECFKQCYRDLQCFSLCRSCIGTVHSHEDRLNHRYTQIHIPPEYADFRDSGTIPRQYMELFAVLCIETSHYVAFVKCGTGPDPPWCFFDSMADRRGEFNGCNIPEVVFCQNLPAWLSDNGAQSFCDIKDDKNLPTYAKRLLCDAYMCMYQSTDMIMYR